MSADWPGIAIGKFDTRFGADKSLPVRRLDWLDGTGDGICFSPERINPMVPGKREP